MRRPLTIGAATLVTFVLGAMLAVLVAGSASAASPTTTAKKTTTTTSPSLSTGDTTTTTESPGDTFLVLNGTVNAASDHEIVASSAFPNYTTGAVDNYYSLAHSHVDNSPFAQGTASPFDTGPIGQTAAAGNTQQPQYADARWPGSSGKATFGNEGGPSATATADEYKATADATLATNRLSGPAASSSIVIPKGLNGRLRMALAAWKAKWQGLLAPTKPAGTAPLPKPSLPKPPLPKPPLPKVGVTTPAATVTAPAVGGVSVPTPTPVQAPPPAVPTPTVPTPTASAPSRSLASDSTPTDGESLLASSTSAGLVETEAKPKAKTATTTTSTTKTKTTKTDTTKAQPAKAYALVTSGESSLGRVTLGGGQIVIEGIHVTASIRNDGTPTYKAGVSVGSATIGGVPVTIDEDGVHVAGQGSALPYKQASDALNNALKQAGIQLFLVGPEVTTCGPASGGGTDTTTTTTTTSTTSTDQSGGNGSSDACGQGSTGGGSCDQASGSGGGTGIGTPPAQTQTTSTTETTTTSSCDQSATCDQMGSGTGTGSGTTTTATTTSRASTTRTDTTSTSTTTSSGCDSAGTTSGAGVCSPAGTGSGTQTAGPAGMTGPGNPLSFDFGASNAGEQTVDATGVHVVFDQPVNQSGVPSQHIEHILGEVFVDSLATPLDDTSSNLDLSAGAVTGGGSCFGGSHSSRKAASGGGLSAGGGAAGGASATGALSQSASGYGSGSQPISGSSPTGNSLPVAFATALRKPLWLLLAYLVWQALVIGTGVSLWNWRRGDVS